MDLPQARALAEGLPLPDPPTIRQQAEVLVEHWRLAEQVYGDRCGPLMRKFGIKYSALHPRYEQVRDAFIHASTRDNWQAVLGTWYADDGPGQYPDGRIHRAQGSQA